MVTFFTEKHEYFPAGPDEVPFGAVLNALFFSPEEGNHEFAIHGPNVIRLAGEILAPADTSDLFARPTAAEAHARLEKDLLQINQKLENVNTAYTLKLLKIAALYHDIGKYIRKANHPQIGAHLLRNFDVAETRRLVEALGGLSASPDPGVKHNRFALIVSITQHHDKFGVVTTGEGSLALFSDIPYFTSDRTSLNGICKNITSVMLLNLADAAAVCPPDADREKAVDLAQEVMRLRKKVPAPARRKRAEERLLDQLAGICRERSSCMGLSVRKINDMLHDWAVLIEAVGEQGVAGSRTRLKGWLLHMERNPARTITRIRRLLVTCAEGSGGDPLLPFFSPTTVESVLVGSLGAHQFPSFCARFGTVVKLDYALNVFRGLLCAGVRRELHRGPPPDPAARWTELTVAERAALPGLGERALEELAVQVTALFVKVLVALVNRYSGVLGQPSRDPRRFGFQLKELANEKEPKIRETIFSQLCGGDRDYMALTWMADEVSVWAMD